MNRRAADAKLEVGRAALARGDWRAARDAFTAALEGRESASALEGLSEALWWLDEVPESISLRERAFALWHVKGELRRAARAAVWLAREHAAARGDVQAASAWLDRASELATQAGPGAEAGWVELMRARFAPDGAAAARHSARARECGREHGDRDLELAASSEHGHALVITGRLAEGMRLLDEAVAAADRGEMQSLHAAGEVYRNVIVACDRALDLERAARWCRVVDEFARKHHLVPLFAACQDVYGGLLVATGRWPVAESALTRSARTLEKGHPALRAQPLARLAQLRVRQGQLDDAARLLAGIEDQPPATAAMAELLLARGEPARAAALLERRLETAAGDAMMAWPLLEALVEARLEEGDLESARAAAGRLDTLATETAHPVLEAGAVLAAARVLEEGAEPPDAQVQQALELYATAGLLFEAARARLQWARATDAARKGAAAADATRALQVFEQLGAALWAAAARELLTGARNHLGGSGARNPLGGPGAKPRRGGKLPGVERRISGARNPKAGAPRRKRR